MMKERLFFRTPVEDADLHLHLPVNCNPIRYMSFGFSRGVRSLEKPGTFTVGKLKKFRKNREIKVRYNSQGTFTARNTIKHEEPIPPREKVQLMVRQKNISQIRKRIQENISNKPNPLEQLKEFFNGEPGRYLPQNNLFKDGIPSPFERLSVNFDEGFDSKLSVTKLLWFSHCELERIYLLYLSDNFSEYIEGIEHGVVLHRSLEKEAHPRRRICVSVNGQKIYVETDRHYDYVNFESEKRNITEKGGELASENSKEGIRVDGVKVGPRNYPTVISSRNPKNTQAYLLLETLGRLIVLLRQGSCREIYTHGYFTSKTNKFAIDGYGDGIPVNGMIDELKLVSDNTDELTQLMSHMNAPDVPTSTYDEFIKEFNQYIMKNNPKIHLNVKEYKSRKSGTKPNRYFVRTHLLQASIYYKLFKQGASNAESYYQSWVHESNGRGLHVYEPLDNDLIAFCCIAYPMFFEECMKMKYGYDMEFGNVSFKPPQHPYVFKNTTNRKSLYALQGNWVYTPTLAHILARIAQVQNLTANFDGGKVEVEYLNLDRKSILVQTADYDNEFMEKGVLNGMNLWLGRRDPTATINKALCMKCQFNDHCKVGARRISKR